MVGRSASRARAENDAERAATRFHLTAYQAGLLARRAQAKTVVPFHFSPRYEDGGVSLRDELARALTLPGP